MARGSERRDDAIVCTHIVRKAVQQDHRKAARVPALLIGNPEARRVDESRYRLWRLGFRPVIARTQCR